jgi:NitT/TauT family transport system permease protein
MNARRRRVLVAKVMGAGPARIRIAVLVWDALPQILGPSRALSI